MNIKEQKIAAKTFFEKWSTKEVSERGGYQIFWIELLQNVLGDTNASSRIMAEKKIRVGNHTNFIDIYLPDVNVIIEQKNRGIKLDKKAEQSDGSFLTPFEQAKKYNDELSKFDKADYIITSNFDEIWVYNMVTPKVQGVYEPIKILLPEVVKHSEYLKNILVKKNTDKIELKKDISFKAGSIIGKIYNALYKQYEKVYSPLTEEILRDLNKLCVRLVFCFYAEDCDLFPEYNYFQHYMDKVNADKFRKELIDVFDTLDTDYPSRDEFIEKALNEFPYVNGGLFQGKIKIPQFDDKLKKIIHEASVFDWSKISPAIFGAIFESTLNPVTRKKRGMHYTTIENIHKVIDPLFLDDLKQEFETIKNNPRNKKTNLENFQNKIANLKFLDPACGSGNFLTETYICLRRLENEVLIELNKGQMTLGYVSKIKVSISQFYGIEINDFAVDVAKAAMWIAENQMLNETKESVEFVDTKPLPLNTNDNIVNANALRIDWESVVPKSELNYIIGNPPFSAGRRMSDEQRKDMLLTANEFPKNGDLDYVCCWYIKSSKFINGTSIKTGFVSTSSITQGEQVSLLWRILIEKYELDIIYGIRSFNWESEATVKAGVHCVIILFQIGKYIGKKYIIDNGIKKEVNYINGYLMENNNIWIDGAKKPICNVPRINNGSKPLDNAICAFTPKEKKEFIKKEPNSEPYFYKYMGSEEFINNIDRYFLLINKIPLNLLSHMPLVLDKLKQIKEYRLKSDSAPTKKLAETPANFHFENIPDENYLVIPQTSSGRRKYVPIGFLTPNVLVNNKLQVMRDGGLYELGVLSSNVHNSWLRTIGGRFREDYTYSVSIVYNTFPWPNTNEIQKRKIEQTAKGILDARLLYPNASLADLYNPLIMPSELKKAHKANDEAVLEAYGLPKNSSETEIVSHLMNLYLELTKDKVKPEKKTKKSREKKATK